MSYKRRAKPKLTATFTDSAGSAIDPDAVLIEILNPDGTYDGYAYGLSSQGSWNATTNVPTLADGTGTAGHYYTNVYHYLDDGGDYYYRAEGLGSKQTSNEGTIVVDHPLL